MAGRRSAPSAGAPLRTVGVLTAKYLADTVKSPAMVASCFVPLTLLLMMKGVMGGQISSPEDARSFASTTIAYALLFESIMVSSMIILYAMAEEREKHLLRTLALADVSLGQAVAARGIVAVAATIVTDALCVAAFGMPAHLFAPLVAISVLGSIPLLLGSLALGLFARDQMSVMVLDTPLVLVAILPMVLSYDDALARFVPYLPTGGLYEFAMLGSESRLFSADAVLPAVLLLAWTAASAVALAVALKHAPRADA